MARYAFSPGSPPNFSYRIIDTDVVITIPQFQQMIVCHIFCIRSGGELEILEDAELVIL